MILLDSQEPPETRRVETKHTNLTFLVHPTIAENEMVFYAENIKEILNSAIK